MHTLLTFHNHSIDSFWDSDAFCNNNQSSFLQ
jgi:hypothetical protein